MKSPQRNNIQVLFIFISLWLSFCLLVFTSFSLTPYLWISFSSLCHLHLICLPVLHPTHFIFILTFPICYFPLCSSLFSPSLSYHRVVCTVGSSISLSPCRYKDVLILKHCQQILYRNPESIFAVCLSSSLIFCFALSLTRLYSSLYCLFSLPTIQIFFLVLAHSFFLLAHLPPPSAVPPSMHGNLLSILYCLQLGLDKLQLTVVTVSCIFKTLNLGYRFEPLL